MMNEHNVGCNMHNTIDTVMFKEAKKKLHIDHIDYLIDDELHNIHADGCNRHGNISTLYSPYKYISIVRDIIGKNNRQLPTSHIFLIMLSLTISFFFVELITGIIIQSLTLQADAFHMLSDSIALIIGYVSMQMASKEKNDTATFGWISMEIVGSLINCTFLLAVCLNILLESFHRFSELDELESTLGKGVKELLIVGGIGLVINIIGLFLFHQDGHSHGGHGHSHGGHGHSHGGHGHSNKGHGNSQEKATTEVDSHKEHGNHEGDGHSHRHEHEHGHEHGHEHKHEHEHGHGHGHEHEHEHEHEHGHKHEHKHKHEHEHEHEHIHDGHSEYGNSHKGHLHGEYAHIKENLQEIKLDTPQKDNGAGVGLEYDDIEQGISSPKKVDENQMHNETINNSNNTSENENDNENDNENMNVKAVFLHVLGDALGSVGVIISGLIILFCSGSIRFIVDPLCSITIVVIIVYNTVPILIECVKILLHMTPSHIDISKIRKKLEEIEIIENVHELHIWSLTNKRIVCTLHIIIKEEYENLNNNILDLLKLYFHSLGVHSSTIQIENISTNEQNTNCREPICMNKKNCIDSACC